ncbi:ABC transporter substrate-binding protein [Aquipseudomonas guryensis]|uniref:Carbohydrate ABC transporter substrate-binding protein n=1 Tax=Aquipseudomonas guryensis TaxID=2759165 RepID=A0A7W4D919_9GAMM|nr:ABC transporter substrate-binding protein [Pseudomonas guryensis]MBB1518235.1 carbohydrate ABC transporter substrate-binding protein [Pseudomonas guryensis]
MRSVMWLVLLFSTLTHAANPLQEAIAELQPSSLAAAEQRAELAWFAAAGKPFAGVQVRVIAEHIPTHWYEATVLAPLFSRLTGIRVIHEISGEDDVVNKLRTQQQTGLPLYDAYVSDSDLLGQHFRDGQVLVLSDFIDGEGASVTSPTLDLADFIGLPFVTAPDGKLYQLPDQQFANLYWYRQDWFERPELRQAFRERYGYELDVPQNWSAYEDIAAFFTEQVGEIDGQRVYGHMDYGGYDPSLGWRLSDAWLGMAGVADLGLPNGLPVDDWGIRVEGCRPAGASMARGGGLDSPAAVYALQQYVDWLKRYAPPEAQQMSFNQAGNIAAQGHVAQQIFWYTAFTADYTKLGTPVVDGEGKPKWRVAPSPRGAYWQDGMKSGYQDVGAWTLLANTPLRQRQAAWLYAQFVTAKSVSLRKTLVGLTPIRRSDLDSPALLAEAPRLGGLVEFYRSRAARRWTPTGANVPDYSGMASLWWRQLHPAISGQLSAAQALHNLAGAFDQHLQVVAQRQQNACAPQLNPPRGAQYWLPQPGAPWPQLADERPPGRTLKYQEALRAWD